MASDWIKMRVGLRRHPKIVRIVSALKADRLRVVGALHAVWSVFDEHSVDGILPGYSFEMMDEEIGWPGFSQAMHGVQWLDRDDDCGLVMPRFDSHNGASAKRRAQEADRKREARSDVGKASASDADTKRTRERIEKDLSPSLRSGDTPRPKVKGKTNLPDDFAVCEETRKVLTEEGFGPYLEMHLRYFVDYCTSNGKRYNDFDKAFRNSVRADWGEVRRNTQRAGFKPGQKPPNGAARPGEPWYITWTGIQNEALRRGITRGEEEIDADFTNRVFATAGVTREQAAKDRLEWRGEK